MDVKYVVDVESDSSIVVVSGHVLVEETSSTVQDGVVVFGVCSLVSISVTVNEAVCKVDVVDSAGDESVTVVEFVVSNKVVVVS